jgi:GT2 family glycosyltransferase
MGSDPLRPTPPLLLLRQSADILRVAAASPPVLRPWLIEFFRSQNEFNHRVVDLLEDLPWLSQSDALTSRVQHLTLQSTWRPLVSNATGFRAHTITRSKRLALRVSRRAFRGLIEQLNATNAALLQAVVNRDPAACRAACASFSQARWPLQTVKAQLCFYQEVASFLSAFGDRAFTFRRPWAAPKSTFTARELTVLVCGETPAALDIDGADNVRYPTERLADGSTVTTGDVEDVDSEWILRTQGNDTIRLGQKFVDALQNSHHDLVYGDAHAGGVPVFRSAWSPERLWEENFVGQTFAIRTRIAIHFKLHRAQPALHWLLTPRFESKQVAHVAEAISFQAAPLETDAREFEVVAEEIRRRRLEAEVRKTADGRRSMHFHPRPCLVSIVVPFRDKVELLRQLIDSLVRFDAGVPFELWLVSNHSQQADTFSFLEKLNDPRIRWFECNEPFNFSRLNNLAAKRAKGEFLLFLNNDTAACQHHWLADLVGYAQQPQIAVVGARLLYPDESIQHAGVVIGLKGLTGHLFARWHKACGTTPFGWPESTRNWSAVTGACLLISRTRFERIGGFDERMLVSGGDIELCLRATSDGSRIVSVGHVALFHYESLSRGTTPVDVSDVERELRAYASFIPRGDPFFHPAIETHAAHGGPALVTETLAEHFRRAVEPWGIRNVNVARSEGEK